MIGKMKARYYAIADMKYDEMIACSDRIGTSAKWSLFERWVRIHKYTRMSDRYVFVNNKQKTRISDGLLKAGKLSWLKTINTDILVELKNYKEASTVPIAQVRDYLVYCDKKNKAINVGLKTWNKIGIRYIFSRHPGSSLNVFRREDIRWFDKGLWSKYENCEEREIWYYNINTWKLEEYIE